jgi:hypothetical protein
MKNALFALLVGIASVQGAALPTICEIMLAGHGGMNSIGGRLHAEAIIAAIEAFTSSQIGLPANLTNDAGIT